MSGPELPRNRATPPSASPAVADRARQQKAAPAARKKAPKDWLENPQQFGWNPSDDDWLDADSPDARAARAIARQCHAFVKAVRTAKGSNGVSDADLARELGKHENSVGRYLRGDAPMSLWVMDRMAAFLQLDVTLVVTPANKDKPAPRG